RQLVPDVRLEHVVGEQARLDEAPGPAGRRARRGAGHRPCARRRGPRGRGPKALCLVPVPDEPDGGEGVAVRRRGRASRGAVPADPSTRPVTVCEPTSAALGRWPTRATTSARPSSCSPAAASAPPWSWPTSLTDHRGGALEHFRGWSV